MGSKVHPRNLPFVSGTLTSPSGTPPTIPHPHPASFHCSDIKPENIMFAADGGLRLGDFGLSIDARLERPTSRVGTLDYM